MATTTTRRRHDQRSGQRRRQHQRERSGLRRARRVQRRGQLEDNDTSTPEAATALATDLEPLWDAAAEAAPPTSQDNVDLITEAIADLKGGDAATFNADDTFAAYTSVVAEMVEPCGFATSSVTATESDGEYGFEGLPDTLEAGTHAITLKNEGAEDHVIIFYRKNDGETRSAEELLALGEEEGSKAGTEEGAVFAPPGAEAHQPG